MVGGTVVGVVNRSDRITLVVNGTDHDSHIEVIKEVYPTGYAQMVRVGDEVWWQSGVVYWNGGVVKEDVPLVIIRQNDGDDKPWTYEEAARMAGVE